MCFGAEGSRERARLHPPASPFRNGVNVHLAGKNAEFGSNLLFQHLNHAFRLGSAKFTLRELSISPCVKVIGCRSLGQSSNSSRRDLQGDAGGNLLVDILRHGCLRLSWVQVYQKIERFSRLPRTIR